MKNLLIAAAGLALVSTVAVEAEAGPFDKLKKAAKKVEKAKYKKYNWALQCVSFDGSERLDNTKRFPAWSEAISRVSMPAACLPNGRSLF